MPDDEWAPLSMVSRCEAAGVPADVLKSDAQSIMQHAFSIQMGSCSRMAEWTADAVESMLAAGADAGAGETNEKRGAPHSSQARRRRARSPTATRETRV